MTMICWCFSSPEAQEREKKVRDTTTQKEEKRRKKKGKV